jgi:hypothetical protein
MFSANTHMASCLSIVPEGPYLWKVHFVILKKNYMFWSTLCFDHFKKLYFQDNMVQFRKFGITSYFKSNNLKINWAYIWRRNMYLIMFQSYSHFSTFARQIFWSMLWRYMHFSLLEQSSCRKMTRKEGQTDKRSFPYFFQHYYCILMQYKNGTPLYATFWEEFFLQISSNFTAV